MSAADEAVGALKKLSSHVFQVSRALAYIANATDLANDLVMHADRMSAAAEEAAKAKKAMARMAEVEAVSRCDTVPGDACTSCGHGAYNWETFCKACGRTLAVEHGSGSYSAL